MNIAKQRDVQHDDITLSVDDVETNVTSSDCHSDISKSTNCVHRLQQVFKF